MTHMKSASGRGRDGKYMAGLERVCWCGRTLGNHLSERPYPQDDTSDGFPDCEGFKKAKEGAA